MKAKTIMKRAPVDWKKTVDRLKLQDRDTLRQELERIAIHAAMLAEYLDKRHGYGCGDQGHEAAMRKANKIGKLVRMKGFGYNGYYELTV